MNRGCFISSLTNGIDAGHFRRGIADIPKFRDPEVEHLDAITAEAVRFQPDVVWFQVPVNHALLMGLVHRGANLFENIDYPVERQTLLFSQHVAERATVEVFHD